MSNIFNRIYNDYFMKNRYGEYEKLIKELLNNGYSFIRICDYSQLNENGKHIIIRHDIDSDVKIAKKMFEIEKKHKVKSTYYFRNSTFDKDFMKEIEKYGSEVGYHYEEIATYCKKNKINTKEGAIKNMDKIKSFFCDNIYTFEKEFDIKLKSIASHGDFYNRKIDLPNRNLFDKELRKKFPNIVEAYDDEIEKKLDSRMSDCMYPNFWKPKNPMDCIKNNDKNILILVHTRWWDKNPLERFKLDLIRLLNK